MSQAERDAFFEVIKDCVRLLNVAYLWKVPVDEQWRMSYRELMERINALTGCPDETPAPEAAPPEAARRWRCEGCGEVVPEKDVEGIGTPVVYHVGVEMVSDGHGDYDPEPYQCGPVVEESGSTGEKK